MNVVCVLHVFIKKLEKRVNGSEKSGREEPEDTQDSETGQMGCENTAAQQRP